MKPSTHWRQTFAERLVEICTDMGLPERGRQTQLAKIFKVTQQAVRKWLDGATYPETEKIVAMAEWADVNVNWLLQGSGPKRGNRIDVKALVIDEIVRSLPAEERREALGFLRYELDRTRAIYSSERLERYKKLLDNFEPPGDKPKQ